MGRRPPLRQARLRRHRPPLHPVAALVPTHRRIILDLTGLTHMDSMGIGTLLRLYVHGKTHHSRIELQNIGARIMELLVMANLLPVFTTIGEHGTRL